MMYFVFDKKNWLLSIHISEIYIKVSFLFRFPVSIYGTDILFPVN